MKTKLFQGFHKWKQMLEDYTLRRSAIVSLQRFFVKDIKSRYHLFFYKWAKFTLQENHRDFIANYFNRTALKMTELRTQKLKPYTGGDGQEIFLGKIKSCGNKNSCRIKDILQKWRALCRH